MTATTIKIEYTDEKTGDPDVLVIGSEAPDLDSALEEAEARCALIRALRRVRTSPSMAEACAALNALEEASERLSRLVGESVRPEVHLDDLPRIDPAPSHETGAIAWDRGWMICPKEVKSGMRWEIRPI